MSQLSEVVLVFQFLHNTRDEMWAVWLAPDGRLLVSAECVVAVFESCIPRRLLCS